VSAVDNYNPAMLLLLLLLRGFGEEGSESIGRAAREGGHGRRRKQKIRVSEFAL
jgi:hypothetical protein